MSRLGERFSQEAGFTVAEYLAAVVILLVVVLGTMGGLAYAGSANAMIARRDQAMTIANQQLEQARNQNYDDLGVSWPGTNPTTDPSGVYTINDAVSWARDATNHSTVRLVTVTVSWQTPQPGSVQVQTRIFGLSSITNSGDVIINVVQSLSGGGTAPLPAASVVVTPSVLPVLSGTTDSSGAAFFGKVAAGAFTFYASAIGYVVDMSPYPSGASVTNGGTTTCQVTAYQPSSYVFTFTCPGQTVVPAVPVSIAGAKTNPLMSTSINGNQTTFNNLLPDNYAITFTTPTGYTISSPPTNFSITAGGTNSGATITLVKNTQLVVTVTDDRGAGYPVSGATVTLSGAGTGSTTTNASGQATFQITTAGTYTITASLANYISGTASQVMALGTDGAASVSMARYGNLVCTYTNSTTKVATIYVYTSTGAAASPASGTTRGSSPNTATFTLPPATYYYVSTKSTWTNNASLTAVKTGAVTSGGSTAVSVSSSN